MKTDEFEMPPMECRARRSRAVFKISIGFHTPCGRPAVAAADLEGFANSAAAGGGEEHAGVRSSRRRYGVTFLHIAATAAIWTYVSAYLSVVGRSGRANVAVARVSCIFRVSAAVDAVSGAVMLRSGFVYV